MWEREQLHDSENNYNRHKTGSLPHTCVCPGQAAIVVSIELTVCAKLVCQTGVVRTHFSLHPK